MGCNTMFDEQEKIRTEEFPQLLDRVWLNSSAFVPHPKSVVKAMHRFINYFHNPGIGEPVDDYQAEESIGALNGAAKMFNCTPDDVSLVINTAHGLNFPMLGIEWKKGDNLVTSALEFPANYYPWKYISRKKCVEFREAKINEKIQISEDEIIDLIDDNTKLVALSLVQFSNGQRVDAKKITKAAHDHGALVAFDAIQACGATEVYPKEMDADFVSAGGPKYLMAPLGIGLCYINPKIVDSMEPPMQGVGNYDFSDRDWMHREKPYHKGAKRFQNGTVPYYCVAGLNASLKLINSIGIQKIANHNHSLIDILIEGLEDLDLRIITPYESSRRGVLAHARVDKNKNLNKIVQIMEEKYKVTISTRFDGLRFSVQLYNTEDDIHTALKALKATLKEV